MAPAGTTGRPQREAESIGILDRVRQLRGFEARKRDGPRDAEGSTRDGHGVRHLWPLVSRPSVQDGPVGEVYPQTRIPCSIYCAIPAL